MPLESFTHSNTLFEIWFGFSPFAECIVELSPSFVAVPRIDGRRKTSQDSGRYPMVRLRFHCNYQGAISDADSPMMPVCHRYTENPG